jgi:hypothetical protein
LSERAGRLYAENSQSLPFLDVGIYPLGDE